MPGARAVSPCAWLGPVLQTACPQPRHQQLSMCSAAWTCLHQQQQQQQALRVGMLTIACFCLLHASTCSKVGPLAPLPHACPSCSSPMLTMHNCLTPSLMIVICSPANTAQCTAVAHAPYLRWCSPLLLPLVWVRPGAWCGVPRGECAPLPAPCNTTR